MVVTPGRTAERLNGETRLPALPSEVAQAFFCVWQQAIHLTQGAAEQALAEQRQVLTAEREQVAAVEELAREDAALARQHSAAAQASARPARPIKKTSIHDESDAFRQIAVRAREISTYRRPRQVDRSIPCSKVDADPVLGR